MAESKIEVLLKVAEVNLGRAEKRFDAGEYDSAVFHASLAVESAVNALILKLGGDEAKDRRAINGLVAVIRRVKPDMLKDRGWVKLIESGREIQREVVYARYPLRLGGKWVSPMEYYTREKSRRIIDNARIVFNGIKEYFR